MNTPPPTPVSHMPLVLRRLAAAVTVMRLKHRRRRREQREQAAASSGHPSTPAELAASGHPSTPAEPAVSGHPQSPKEPGSDWLARRQSWALVALLGIGGAVLARSLIPGPDSDAPQLAAAMPDMPQQTRMPRTPMPQTRAPQTLAQAVRSDDQANPAVDASPVSDNTPAGDATPANTSMPGSDADDMETPAVNAPASAPDTSDPSDSLEVVELAESPGYVPLAAGSGAALQAELVRQRTEILRLQAVFQRLLELAELDDGEFDLDPVPLPDVLPESRPESKLRGAANDQTGSTDSPPDASGNAEQPLGAMYDQLDLMKQAMASLSAQVDPLRYIVRQRRQRHDQQVSGKVLVHGVRTSGFGFRKQPFGNRRVMHRGLDFTAAPGEPVLALADGVVSYSGPNGAYGNLVEIEHAEGFRTRYAHNRENLVQVGERVGKHQIVATLGSSGRSTGPHVHVEVRQHGAALDPQFFIR